jgi:hypothetical protein
MVGRWKKETMICARRPGDGSDRQDVGKLGKEENGWKLEQMDRNMKMME